MAIKHRIRSKHGKEMSVTTTPTKAIRLFCIECMGYSLPDIPKCTAPLCPLHPYRMGNAHTGRKGNAAALQRAKSEQGGTPARVTSK